MFLRCPYEHHTTQQRLRQTPQRGGVIKTTHLHTEHCSLSHTLSLASPLTNRSRNEPQMTVCGMTKGKRQVFVFNSKIVVFYISHRLFISGTLDDSRVILYSWVTQQTKCVCVGEIHKFFQYRNSIY